MFKKIAKKILKIKTVEDFNQVCGDIEIGWQKGLLTWDEHEILHGILGLMDYEKLVQ